MIQVALLTIEQKNLLVGQQFATDSYFNPVQNNSDNWVISIVEVNDCTNVNYLWVKELPLITFEPKIVELP